VVGEGKDPVKKEKVKSKVVFGKRGDRVVAFFQTAATALAEGQRGERDVRRQLSDANPKRADDALSPIDRAAAVDGSLFEMRGARLVVRASGTDALIRYYIETTSRKRLDSLEHFVASLTI
jgi:phosphomannomutase